MLPVDVRKEFIVRPERSAAESKGDVSRERPSTAGQGPSLRTNGFMSDLPRDRDLVRLHWPPELRRAFDALFGIDDALAEVVQSASQPGLAAIKLAWWREALERLDQAPPPAEPRLKAAAAELLTRGITGAELAGLEDGWLTLAEEQPDRGRIRARGERLFGLAARLLGDDGESHTGGGLWAETDAARRLRLAMPRGREPLRATRKMRPITILAALANRDAERGNGREPEATPGRAWTLLRHRLTGR